MKESMIKVWEEKVVIPTYETGKPDKNPMFFEKRVYQGSSGVIYPNPIIEKIYDEKKDKTYTALFLENQYLKIMILPELGGRVQMAYDKIKQRHFIYYNRVIKPALVGLCGPWISGGIEFNWPQHHRPSTFEPVDYSIEENEDGSKTVWVNEVERMFHTKGMAGFTLHPGKAYLEIKVKLFNRTSVPQTFLWWANPAVKVNDHYQSVFPPDVHAVFDHGKRDVSTFPIATGEYYKVNYAPGTDISRYKNIPVPTSYMAVNSAYDFVGGYEHDTQAGVLHVANHHVSPGKKQWTWGHGDFGKAWDRNLTDEDGPYIELMTGMFTDNQPDFSWLMPYEEKSFTQYFMPYRELGVVKNATKDVLVNVEKQNDGLVIKIFSTSSMAINIELKKGNELIFKESYNSSPELVYSKTIAVSEDVSAENILLILMDHAGRELLRYDNKENSRNDIPEPAEAVAEPEDVENNEKLYLIGLHLEQYRHATYSPVPYYEEALHRDAGDIRNNNALGLWYFRHGKFVKSESYFRKAIETLVHRNPNPYDGEPYYNLGVCLKMQDRLTEAYGAFYKATWNAAWQETGYFSLAQIDMARGNYETALEHIQNALDRNAKNSKAYTLKIVALRKLKHYQNALQVCKIALEKDRFNLSVLFEQYKIYEALGDNATATQFLEQLNSLARGSQHNYIEYTLDYSGAGLYPEMIELLLFAIEESTEPDYPMLWYYLGWAYHQSGNVSESLSCFERTAISGSDYCFPNRLEDILVLQMASALHPSDARAPYYLGNLWYDKRQYDDAIEQWELALQRDPAFPTVLRNLGIAYFNKRNDLERSVNCYEKAFELNPADARVLMELDQLYKRLNKDPRERLSFLEKHINVVEQRDDLYLERISLYNFLGEFELSFDLIRNRKFHPWEGGEGKISAQYIHSLVGMAKQQIQNSQYARAIELLEQAQVYPHYLSEGKLFGASENDIFYWLACAYEGLADDANTKICLQKATQGLSEPTAAMFYNDQQPDKIFYQGLAWKALGKKELASEIFSRLIEYGREHLNAEVKIDYFAVSLPDLLIFEDDLGIRNQIHCYYMMGLGYLGLNKKSDAKQCLKAALDKDTMHYGACIHLAMVNSKMIEVVL